MMSVKDQAVVGLRRRAGRGLGFGSTVSMRVYVSRFASSLYRCVHA
jgi:hypothetical protein